MAYNADRRTILARGLKAARRSAELNATDAAKFISAMGIQCTRGTLFAWERGAGATSREPYASDLVVIARVYRCTVNDFFAQSEVHAANGQPETNGQQVIVGMPD